MSLEGGPAPGARSWPTEEGGRESLLIYLLPWHSPRVGAPPRAGTDGVPGSQQYLSSLGHPPGEMHLSPTQEATRGGIWRSRDPRGLRGLKEPGSRFRVSECRLLCLRHCSCLHTHIPSLPRSTGSSSPRGLPGSQALCSHHCGLSLPLLCLGPAAFSA